MTCNVVPIDRRADAVRAAFGRALGVELAASARRWKSRSFNGLRLVLAADRPLPAGADEIEVEISGTLIVDIVMRDPSTLEVLTVEVPS